MPNFIIPSLFILVMLPGFPPYWVDGMALIISMCYASIFTTIYVCVVISLLAISLANNELTLNVSSLELLSIFRFLLIPGLFKYLLVSRISVSGFKSILGIVMCYIVLVESLFFLDREFYLSLMNVLYLFNGDFMASVPGYRALGGGRVSLIFYQPMTEAMVGFIGLIVGAVLSSFFLIILGIFIIYLTGSSSIWLTPIVLVLFVSDRFFVARYLSFGLKFQLIVFCLAACVSFTFVGSLVTIEWLDFLTSGRFDGAGNIAPVLYAMTDIEWLVGGGAIFQNFTRFMGDNAYTMMVFNGGMVGLFAYLCCLIYTFYWLLRPIRHYVLPFSLVLICIFFDVGGFGASSPKVFFLVAVAFVVFYKLDHSASWGRNDKSIRNV